MKLRRRLALAATTIAALLAVTAASPAATGDLVLDAEQALRISQDALGRPVGDYVLRGADGDTVRIADFRGKPLVINLVYTACAHSCPVIVQTLADAVSDAQSALGRDSFKVITIGFDTAHDTPARMRSFARQQGIDLPNWQFLAIGGEAMRRLAADLGFVYFASPKGFDHLAQVSVIDGNGQVYRQVYGEYFETPFLVEPLKNLVFGRGAAIVSLDDLVDRLRLFCTLYDPAAQRYRFDYSVFIGFGIGLAALGGIGFVLVRNLLRIHRTQRRRPPVQPRRA